MGGVVKMSRERGRVEGEDGRRFVEEDVVVEVDGRRGRIEVDERDTGDTVAYLPLCDWLTINQSIYPEHEVPTRLID